ncbi:hypothetical protein CHS0354_030080 [Potamilus streckersoni]|uniref:adenosine deaminase n=1 Tax=Potamilus streckersoni TaxID=2493646 RepID=A0AAE0RLR0_9BIVA|nr:hypothetical protein CHS0354_030080 [Potamilus streckersoni]
MTNPLRNNKEKTARLIASLPKTDIHLHFDGSIRLNTIIELAKKDGVELPAYTEEGLGTLVFKDSYNNLEEYLRTFGYSCAVLQRPENLERVAYEIAEDNWKEGVRYIEVRFAPQLLMNKYQDYLTIMNAVNKGLRKAQALFNADPDVKSGAVPPFKYGIIVCAMRFFGPWSEHYQDIYRSFAHSSVRDIVSLGSEAVADATVKLKQTSDMPVVAFDIAGAENGYPANWHASAFRKTREAFIHSTVHAGEAYDAESIHQAVFDLHAERIGHGFHLFLPDRLQNPDIADKLAYTERLREYIAKRRITLEVCLTSNLQTAPFLKTMASHPFGKMLKHRVSAVLCTDNRTVSKTTVTKETHLAVEAFDMSPAQLKDTVMEGFRAAFFHGTQAEKEAYVRQCETFYDKTAASHGF